VASFPSPPDWTAKRFFGSLAELGPYRIISICGPSVFEAIVNFDHHGFSDGYMNAIRPEYHWHLQVDRFGWVRSRDETHARSGRRVLYFELGEDGSTPFLRIYLHRGSGEDFESQRLQAFLQIHSELGQGIRLSREQTI